MFGIFVLVSIVGVLHESGELGKIHTDVAEAEVEVITGKVLLSPGQGGRSSQPFDILIIENETFIIDRRTFLSFKHLEPYTIYYAPKSKIILSAEPV